MGRKDRTLKVNGQRIALEEVESTLLGYPGVVDATVVSRRGQVEVALLEAHLVMKQKDLDPGEFDNIHSTEPLQVIKNAFCDALMVEMVSDDDDFFKMGGNSISAAHVSHSLEMDMRLLYIFPSPMKLQMALMGKEGLRAINGRADANLAHEESLLSNLKSPSLHSFRPRGRILRLCDKSDNFSGKRQKVDPDYYRSSMKISLGDGYPWDCNPFQVPCSFSRCNKLIYEGSHEGKDLCQKFNEVEIPRNKRVDMKEVWKVHMESCIDASPLVVFKDQDVFVFIGSHSFKFLCINAKSGVVQWETKLEGRIECSAAIIGDFSQVVVGCYQGIIYFIYLLSGSICWHFQTCGEVKCQPVVDECRNLVWCGSHDCNLYALDYRSYCCVYKLSCGGSIYGSPVIDEVCLDKLSCGGSIYGSPVIDEVCLDKLSCGGSIYGSPVIDEVRNTLYVASTSGHVTAISIKAMPFSELWLRELEAPVFGSLSIYSQTGNVLCCLVDGHVIALDAGGSTI
ncbi:hypothetical protein RHMOL_Rhmol01G0204200 [Rhododendron molle]|uniref:Uncharacterized protein n=1 Tax=Rhododendron molle TaxID=49168 RepID=A0ACC0Q6P1_RHOML|nr:hypothetical protein RHMOL_Rhmol01G0204200 [Rhododendron molle]